MPIEAVFGSCWHNYRNYLRIIYRMLLPDDGKQQFKEAGWGSIGSYAVLSLLLMSLLLLGIYPAFLMDIIEVVSRSV